jgi:thiamine biosynthesis lipoprotein
LRLLGLASAALALGGPAGASSPIVRWRGIALGAPARIEFVGVEPERARGAIAAALEELARLEAIFSLFDPNSALLRLDREGRLDDPPLELVEVLVLACRLAALSEGAFDPTIQPLWLAVARDASREERRAARRLVNWRDLEASPKAVVLRRSGMAVTLDGIAQGYLTDRIASLLRAHGVERVLVDLGELRALGSRPDGRPWRIGREGGAPFPLIEGAVATSRALVEGRPRILDPRTGEPPARSEPVTVLASEAVIADGLSTALAVADPAGAAHLLAAFPGARLLTERRNFGELGVPDPARGRSREKTGRERFVPANGGAAAEGQDRPRRAR